MLKKFLVSCLFSFLFILSVNAEDITLSFDTYDVLDKFNETFTSWSDNDYVKNKSKEIAEKYASDYENVLMYYVPIQLGQYSGGVLSYNGSTYNPGFVLYAWNGNKPFYYVKRSNRVYLVKDNNTTTTSFSKSDFDSINIYGYTTTDFSIDNTRSYSSSQLGVPNTLFQCDSVSDNICNIRSYRLYSHSWNYLMPITYYKFDTQENFILPSIKSNDFENTNNFILPNGNIIGNTNPISFNDLMQDNYYNFHEEKIIENTCDKTVVLGAVSNVKEITLNVKGKTSALAEPLKGTFTLNYVNESLLSDSNFTIEFLNNSNVNVVGNYNIKCDSNSKNCYLNYTYNTEDDIEENADFSFKITLNNNQIFPFTKIYACVTNNDYSNISYSYVNASTDSTTTNPSLDNILNDDTPPSSDISSLGNIQGILPPGPVDSLLTIPIKILSIVNNSLGGVCKPINGKFVFNSNIEIPCFSEKMYNNFPTSLDLFINVIPSIFLLIPYLKNVYKRVDRAISLESTSDDEWGGV